VASLARPGGNLTGSFYPAWEVEAKKLELLKESFPGVTRVAVLLPLLSTSSPTYQAMLEALERTARELGVALQPVVVHGPDDFERALTAIAHGQAEALVVIDAGPIGGGTLAGFWTGWPRSGCRRLGPAGHTS